jgi:uncharacterized membrane protein YeiH
MHDLFVIADIIGIIAFSISGFLVGLRHKLDLLGVAIASVLTALGGGIVRDTILGRTPFAFSEYYPIFTLMSVLALTSLIKHFQHDTIERKSLFVISDTIGLVAFSVTGALLAIGAGYNFFGVISLSFITAIGGSVLRDIMINQVPAILISDFYGSIALIVSLLLYLLHVSHEINNTTILAVSLFAIALRLLAYYKKWHLPKIS